MQNIKLKKAMSKLYQMCHNKLTNLKASNLYKDWL